jgi:hypothetical protein
MGLRDRIQRWWSPAQWEDDHPSEATESPQGENKQGGHWWQGGHWFSFAPKREQGRLIRMGPSGATDFERDFKKPR